MNYLQTLCPFLQESLRNTYNGFAKWLSFGGEVIGENDPDEQQKHLRYNDLVATAVMLQNAVDMTRIIGELEREGRKIPQEDLSFLSPYQTDRPRRPLPARAGCLGERLLPA